MTKEKEKTNIAELLKNCPRGMELDCTIVEDVHFDHISDCEKFIYCYINYEDRKTSISFNKYGAYVNLDKSKCVIFPKGKTTWEGFQKLFKDGDVLVHTQNDRFVMSIYKSNESETIINTYTIFWDRGEGLSVGMQICCYTDSTRLATKEEKEKLFQVIKDNGYRWNPETKTLEKLIEPKFKVGDRIRCKNNTTIIKTIGHIYSDGYALYDGHLLYFKEQDEWELVPNKFDINTLKPFESKVLVRDHDHNNWKPSFWGFLRGGEFMYDTVRGVFRQCIPYESNRHLMDTTDDCDKFFKTWEK